MESLKPKIFLQNLAPKEVEISHLHDDLSELLAAGLDVEEDPLVARHCRGG